MHGRDDVWQPGMQQRFPTEQINAAGEHRGIDCRQMFQSLLNLGDRHEVVGRNGAIVGAALAVEIAMVNKRELEPEWHRAPEGEGFPCIAGTGQGVFHRDCRYCVNITSKKGQHRDGIVLNGASGWA